jgi:hypothetical protein
MKKRIQKTEKENGVRTIAISQILILVIATIAFSWMVGSEVKTVSATGEICGAGGICKNQNLCTGGGTIIAGTCPTVGDACCKDNTVTTTCTGECVDQNLCTGGRISIPGDCPNAQVCCQAQDNGGGNDGSGLGKEIINDVKKVAETKAIETVTKKTFWTKVKNFLGIGKKTAETADEAAGAADKAGKSLIQKIFPKVGNQVSNAIGAVAWAAAAYSLINWAAKKWASERNAADIQIAAGVSAVLGVLTVILIGESSSGPIGWIAGVITIIGTLLWAAVGYQKYAREVFTYRVSLWQPTSIGSECNKCNLLTINGENACSEYVCHSYGTACDWINTNTQYETCVEVNKGDTQTPVIKPAKEIYGQNIFPAIDNENYDYRYFQGGARIVYNGSGGVEPGMCVPAFTPITLAFKTNENAHCKLSLEPSATGTTPADAFSKMMDLAEGTVYTLNHTLRLPAALTADQASLEGAGYELTNGGTFRFYIRCEDVRKNINTVDYMMQFCVQQGPDTRPPEITSTNPPTGSYISAGTINVSNFQILTSEPAECRWDTRPTSFSNMAHNFEWCSYDLNSPLEGFDSGCLGNLTGFKNGVDNVFYIACKDHPEWKGNATLEPKRNTGAPETIILKGTTRLLINSITINNKPNNSLIRGSGETVDVSLEVHTSGGAEDGNARCMYSEDGISYSLFGNGGSRDYSPINTENLYMPNGTYKFFIQCYDIAMPTPNTNLTMINFSVQVDGTAPTVVRVYKDENSETLKVITDEVAECVYSTIDECTYAFEDGTSMETTDGLSHSIEWDPNSDFYIKCRDEFEHGPADGACSIEARPFEIAQQA